MREKLFLLTSKRVAARLTNVFDFVWPTAAAIWNLRWQVTGYLQVNPSASHAEVSGRFVAGSGIKGANLHRACLNTSWEDQQQEFARFLLVEFCALYETWCEGALVELGQPTNLAKSFQFPTTLTAGSPTKGVGYGIASINGTLSQTMIGAFYPVLCRNLKYSKPHLEDLLKCYRYFKELRNALVHSGGTTSTAFLDAQAEYLTLTSASLGVKEVPSYVPQTSNGNVKISLRGVVGFGEIVLKLICTLDAELVQSSSAELVFLSRWREKHGTGMISMASNTQAREGRIIRLVRQLDLPAPVVTPQLDALLKSHGLVTY
ncbi:hypothetical protein [Geomonas oryzae]|uniref:hypothetical protein n=1 Tax=Geomonas oryzae TaxID=2364273 RepID=UPI00100A3143|nr:hypothetical protein [Geomonas oryzae]